MCKLLNQWSPSQSAIDVIKLNNISDEQIKKSEHYLKNNMEFNDIKEVEGYDNWDALFIIFCIKANRAS